MLAIAPFSVKWYDKHMEIGLPKTALPPLPDT